MSVDVTVETTIDRPIDAVATYAADPSNAPAWYANIDSIEWLTEPKVETGAKAEFVARFLGRKLEYTYDFIDVTPGERLVMRTAQGPFPMETTYTWSPAGDRSTRMTVRNRGEPAGFSRFVAPFIARAVRRANQKDLAKLKSILESR